MNRTEILSFLEVVKTLNFTEAANNIFLSQQAVSKYVHNLERDLGVTLFRREYGRVRLTEEGDKYAQLFASWVESYRQTAEDLRRIYQQMKGSLRIGYASWINPYGDIDDCIGLFRRQLPRAMFSGRQYNNSRLLNELNSGGLDVAILSSENLYLDREFEKVAFVKDRSFFYAPGNVEGDTIAEDCWGYPFMQFDAMGWGELQIKYTNVKRMEKLGISPANVYVFSDIRFVLGELAAGSCVTISDEKFGHISGFSNLRRFRTDEDFDLYCVWRKLNENPLIPIFARHLCEFYGTDYEDKF